MPGHKGTQQLQVSTKVSVASSEEQGGHSSVTGLTGVSSGGGDSFGLKTQSCLPVPKGSRAQPQPSTNVFATSGDIQDGYFSASGMATISSGGGDSSAEVPLRNGSLTHFKLVAK